MKKQDIKFLGWKEMRRYSKLNKLINLLTTEERITLNAYFMSGDGPLEKGSNLNSIVEYLAAQKTENVKTIIDEAKIWGAIQDNIVDEQLQNTPESNRQISFTLNVAERIDPTSVIVLSRDIGDADRLMLQEINVDSGDYIPVPVEAYAEILRNYADSIEARQAEINRASENF